MTLCIKFPHPQGWENPYLKQGHATVCRRVLFEISLQEIENWVISRAYRLIPRLPDLLKTCMDMFWGRSYDFVCVRECVLLHVHILGIQVRGPGDHRFAYQISKQLLERLEMTADSAL